MTDRRTWRYIQNEQVDEAVWEAYQVDQTPWVLKLDFCDLSYVSR